MVSKAQQSIIKTVLCHPVDHPFNEPVIELGTNQQLFFAFDDLSEKVNSYSYKIVHCDPEWNSSNLSPLKYLNGFYNNRIDQYLYSFNTIIPYTMFSLTLPNNEISIKLSGNYLLLVFNDAYPETPVISQRFSVLESSVQINAAIVNCTNPKYLYTSQQLDLTVAYSRQPVYNPVKDTRLYITQNQDPNTRRMLFPAFVRKDQLVYGDNENNVFDGLSPFRNFQSSSLVYYTQYIKEITRDTTGTHHVILVPSSVPSHYIPSPDRNGNFYIEAENTRNAILEADYTIVHFALRYSQPIPDTEVYIYGKFSNWQLLPELKMEYDPDHRAYIGQAKLKQGYYDYQYAAVRHGNSSPNLEQLQNNFYQTTNEYNIRFYLYDYNGGYFRFAGYKTIHHGVK